MGSRFDHHTDKSEWCSNCYRYRHDKCNGVRYDNGEKKCECSKCLN